MCDLFVTSSLAGCEAGGKINASDKVVFF